MCGHRIAQRKGEHVLSHRNRRIAGAAAITITGLLLVGCAAPSTGTDADVAGEGALSLALGDSITNLYPGLEAGVPNYWIAAASAEGLVSVSPEGEVIPALATEWEQVDPLTYVFTIDQEAVFQDGTPLTMEDVLASIEAARNPEVSPGIVTWGNVDTVEQTGDWEITITLIAPDSSFIFGPSSSAGLFVYPASYWADSADSLGTAAALPVGTGPYQITSFAPDSNITLELSEYWDGEAGAYDTLSFDVIPQANTRLLALKNGDVDLALSVPVTQIGEWESSEGVEITTIEDRSYIGLTFDTAVAPFDEQGVRDAVAHAFDRASVVEQVLNGRGEVATNLISPPQVAPLATGEDARALLAEAPQYPFDLDAAAAALATTSVADGFTVELLYPDSYPELQLSAELLKQNLAEIGVTLDTRSVTTPEWFASMGDREHGIGFMHYTPTSADPAEMINWFLGPENLASFVSPEVDGALNAARTAPSPEDQLDALLSASTIQAGANVYAPLWWGERIFASDGTVQLDGVTSYSLFTSAWPLQLTPASS